jgi:hypothetical protein
MEKIIKVLPWFKFYTNCPTKVFNEIAITDNWNSNEQESPGKRSGSLLQFMYIIEVGYPIQQYHSDTGVN